MSQDDGSIDGRALGDHAVSIRSTRANPDPTSARFLHVRPEPILRGSKFPDGPQGTAHGELRIVRVAQPMSESRTWTIRERARRALGVFQRRKGATSPPLFVVSLAEPELRAHANARRESTLGWFHGSHGGDCTTKNVHA